MKVLLRNTKTGRYSAGATEWVATARQALDFNSVPKATRFALDQKLPAIEIVLKSDVLPEEVVVPVLSEWCGLGCDQEVSHCANTVSVDFEEDEPQAATG